MYSYIIGKIAEIGENGVVIDNNGIGYDVYLSPASLYKLKEGETVKIYTYFQVKEDAHLLFGFMSAAERGLFLKLIEVGGVGCKLAMQILGGADFESVATAIACGDVKALSSIKGVGKKTAERIVLELKEKVEGSTVFESGNGGEIEDAVSALMSLGIAKAVASKAVSDAAKTEKGADRIIAAALKNMDRR